MPANNLFRRIATAIGTSRQQPLQTYERFGIRFDYTTGWAVTKDEPGFPAIGYRYIFVEGPRSSLAIITTIDGVDIPSIDDFAEPIKKEIFREFRSEIVSGTPRSVLERDFLAGPAAFSTQMTEQTYEFRDDTSVTFLQFNAAAEDWDRVSGGFHAILSSLSVQ